MENIQRQIDDGLPETHEPVQEPVEGCSCELTGWRSIGVVSTWFPGKRGVPRQAALTPEAQGVLTLSPTVINNPAFSLCGLEEFSHIWIIFHFHQAGGSFVKTKVAPPRLGGARVGVFGTRAPHRPCPIGLSLVKLDRIDGNFKISDIYKFIFFLLLGNVLYFSGVDMVDGTPVLDIKPYIPQYDDPRFLPTRTLLPEGNNEEASSSSTVGERHVEGEAGAASPPHVPSLCLEAVLDLSVDDAVEESILSNGGDSLREAPDGEEGPVQVAAWITSPSSRLLKV